jgi:hypothetical protein
MPTFFRYWIILLLLVISTSASAIVYASCEVPNRATSRPDTDAGPTQVSVGLYILDISKVDDIEQSFQADFMIDVLWKDSRLGAVAAEVGAPCLFNLGDVWHPGLTMMNRRKGTLVFPETVTVQPDGTVLYLQRYFGNMASPLDLRRFPYDNQELPFIFGSHYAVDDVHVFLDSKRTGASKTFSLAGWSILGRELSEYEETLEVELDGAQAVIPLSALSFTVARSINYYLWKVALPVTVISFMSWAVFWISRKELGPTLAVSSTAILTLIAFMFSLRGVQPPVSYLTHMDFFIYSSLLLLSITHLEGLVSYGLTMSGAERLAHRLDLASRVVIPASFLSLLTWYLVANGHK